MSSIFFIIIANLHLLDFGKELIRIDQQILKDRNEINVVFHYRFITRCIIHNTVHYDVSVVPFFNPLKPN